MAINFRNRKTISIANGGEKNIQGLSLLASHSTILTSNEVEGIEIRLLPPFIKNNRTIKMWPLPGRAKLYCLTLVISDVTNQLTGMIDLNTFPGVADNEYLPINKTIYYWEPASTQSVSPNQVHIMTSIIKSKEQLRDVGVVLRSVKDDNNYKSLIDELFSLIPGSTSLNVITNLSLKLAGIIGQYLGKVDDNPIGTIINSFTRLHGDWDKKGVSNILLPTKNVDFNFELIIRDNQRGDGDSKQSASFNPGTTMISM